MMNLKLSSGSGCFKAELERVSDQVVEAVERGGRKRRYEDTKRNEGSIMDLVLGMSKLVNGVGLL